MPTRSPAALRQHLSGARNLPRSEQAVLLQALVTAVALEAVLRVVPLTRVLGPWSWWTANSFATVPLGRRQVTLPRRATLYRRAAHLVRPERECIPTALLLWGDLLSAGINARFVLGVRSDTGAGARHHAHVWIECAGRAVLDDDAHRFTVLHAWAPPRRRTSSTKSSCEARMLS